MRREECEQLARAKFPLKEDMLAPRLSGRTEDEHVTNVEIGWLFDQHRATFAKFFGWWDIVSSDGRNGMLASLDTGFLSEVWGTEEVEISTALEAIGMCSYRLVQIMRQRNKVVAVARSTLVLVGPKGPEPLPQSARDLMVLGMLDKFGNAEPGRPDNLTETRAG